MARLLCAAAVLAAAAGCVQVKGTGTPDPVITPAAAGQVFAQYEAANNAATHAYDTAGVGRIESGSLAALDQQTLAIRHYLDPQATKPPQPYHFVAPTFLIPRLASFPRWFVVQTGVDTAPGHYLYVFTQTEAHGPWLASAELRVDDTAQLPALATASDGTVGALAPDSTALAIAPDDLAAAWCSYVDSGPDAPPGLFAPGAHTSQARAARTPIATPTMSVTTKDTAAPAYGVVALATADGGALVIFTTMETRTTTAHGRAQVVPTDDDAAFIGAKPQRSITETLLALHAAVVPPPGQGQVSVIAENSGLVAAVVNTPSVGPGADGAAPGPTSSR